MSRILVIDNYDSFTYNLVYYITLVTGQRPDVFRNDKIPVEEAGNYDHIVISPGPGVPSEAGICLELIRRYAPEKNILGICLGHQAIAEAFGGELENLREVVHGISTPILITDPEEILFTGLPEKVTGGRYHSWIVRRENLPEPFSVTCVDENEVIMGLRHKTYRVHGLQFHPESVLTPDGLKIIENWLKNE